MRIGLILITAALPTLLCPHAALAGDWKAIIAKDMVVVANGKMTMDRYSLCKVKVPGAKKTSVQLRVYAEASESAGISRDFFVSRGQAAQTGIIMFLGAGYAKGTAVSATGALDCHAITAPIGKVDVEVSAYMTGEGVQLAVMDAATGTTAQDVTMWADLFEEK
ncbi:hypothetical protein LBMAG42_03610 [Deltaproteobacteria bacterium]|nr:hypothetical protein LBMAG42_03610 [Deltaproteobacteria bacterium]